MHTDDKHLLNVHVIPEPTTSSQEQANTSTKSPPASSTVGSALSATRGKRNGALDGLRGLAVIAVMGYHVVPDPFTGGWLGVDVFLVLSGFLIGSMLLRERIRRGTIDYKRFLVRRARRLLPGLALMLIAILTAAMVWESAYRRKGVAFDVISSALQVSNWRLIYTKESYFAQVGLPSPIRHTWSLGVQEQFYFIFPLLLLFLMMVLKSWRSLIITFAGLAALSTYRMIDLYVPGADPSRVYFGSDTRLSELLVGVIGAIILFQRSQVAARNNTAGSRTWSKGTEKLIGWAGLVSIVLIVYLMFTVDEYSPWLFQGGLILICGVTMIIITAATSPYPNIMTRLLATKPLMKTGDMSYSLYIWHWPIIVYLAPALPASSELTRQVLAVILTIAVSWVSFTYVENPIHKKGLAGLRPRRPKFGRKFAVLSAITILVMSFILANFDLRERKSNLDFVLPDYPYLGQSVDSLPLGVEPIEVVLFGASTVVNLDFDGQTHLTPDIRLTAIGNLEWCTPYDRVEFDASGVRQDNTSCPEFRKKWKQAIAETPNPTAIMMMMTRIVGDFEHHGERVQPGSLGHDAVIREILDDLASSAMENGAARFAVLNLSCQDRDAEGRDETVGRANDISTVKHVNSVIDAWASSRDDVDVYDIYGALCPGDRHFNHIDDMPLYSDGLHYTTDSAPLVWQWIASEVRKQAPNSAE